MSRRWTGRPVPRSFLYVPGNRPHLLAKAGRSVADAVVADLEDAVPPAEKGRARDVVAGWLEEEPAGPERWVRIPGAVGEADLSAVRRPRLDGLVLATGRAGALARLEEWFAAGDAPDCPVVALVEDAAGLREIGAMAQHPHLMTVGIGEVDLLADLRIRPGADSAVAALRLHVVVEAAAAGLAAPVAPTSTDFRDLDGFRATTRALVDAGFRSRTAVHPAQVAVINDVLTPSPAEVASARDVLERFALGGGGVTTDADGRLIDLAVVRAARETVARSGR